jgi:hypothetical protein
MRVPGPVYALYVALTLSASQYNGATRRVRPPFASTGGTTRDRCPICSCAHQSQYRLAPRESWMAVASCTPPVRTLALSIAYNDYVSVAHPGGRVWRAFIPRKSSWRTVMRYEFFPAPVASSCLKILLHDDMRDVGAEATT